MEEGQTKGYFESYCSEYYTRLLSDAAHWHYDPERERFCDLRTDDAELMLLAFCRRQVRVLLCCYNRSSLLRRMGRDLVRLLGGEMMRRGRAHIWRQPPVELVSMPRRTGLTTRGLLGRAIEHMKQSPANRAMMVCLGNPTAITCTNHLPIVFSFQISFVAVADVECRNVPAAFYTMLLLDDAHHEKYTTCRVMMQVFNIPSHGKIVIGMHSNPDLDRPIYFK